jgi:Uma2 family endonuclease
MEYQCDTPGVEGIENGSVILGPKDEVQPDFCLRILPECGGSTFVSESFLHAAPELVVEIASSSESYDLHIKQLAYERSGVKEYVVLVLRRPQVLWFVRKEGAFTPHSTSTDGIFRSPLFGGLWLDPGALIAGDWRRVREVLRKGLASPEHAEFVNQLKHNGDARKAQS